MRFLLTSGAVLLKWITFAVHKSDGDFLEITGLNPRVFSSRVSETRFSYSGIPSGTRRYEQLDILWHFQFHIGLDKRSVSFGTGQFTLSLQAQLFRTECWLLWRAERWSYDKPSSTFHSPWCHHAAGVVHADPRPDDFGKINCGRRWVHSVDVKTDECLPLRYSYVWWRRRLKEDILMETNYLVLRLTTVQADMIRTWLITVGQSG